MKKLEIFEYLKLSSIPLKKLDKNKMPIGIASAGLIEYKNRKILLSVQHATGDMGNWTAELKFVPGKGTQLFQLGAMNFLASMALDSFEVKDIDFSYVSVPNNFTSYFQEIDLDGQIIHEQPRKVCTVEFDSEPISTEEYGFSGLVMPEMHGKVLISEHKVYSGLKYVGKKDDFYQFKLPIKHPGHEHFKGCSGAPIVDSKGNVVALVSHGLIPSNSIFGISLKKYQIALDISYGDLANRS